MLVLCGQISLAFAVYNLQLMMSNDLEEIFSYMCDSSKW